MKVRMTIMLVFLVIIFGSVFGWYAIKQHFMSEFFAHYQPPPVTISATEAKLVHVPKYLKSVGTLKAVNGVNVSTEVSGIITKIYFKSGSLVNEGSPLIQINDSIERADLDNAEAELQLAQLNFTRQQALFKRKAASQATLDQTQATLKQSQAAVEKSKALIAQKNIIAPFTGKVGVRLVNVGQYISPGTTIVTLQAISPIFVDFYLPEQNLPFLQPGQTVKVSVDTHPQQSFLGHITAINSTVDLETHNVLVRAELANEKQLLYPGLFANIHVELPTQQDSIVLPVTAISFSLFGNSVYVIEKHGQDKEGKPILKVKQVYVKTGATHNAQVVITDGIKVGEHVVTSGQLKLENGTRVVVDNTIKLDKKQNEIH